ncbi:MAG: hypothetical protein ACHQRM_03210 [Bacteroidia bacterium]
MKRTFTFKNPETASAKADKSRNDFSTTEPGPEFEPDAQVIQNILNYSKAVQIRKSSWIEELVVLNN